MLALIIVGGAICGQEAVQVTCEAPCHVFMVGEAVEFACEGEVEVTDYDGEVVWEGTADGQISVPDLGPGYYELNCGGAMATFGIIAARTDEDPPDGPLAVDGATAWLSGADQREPIAKMLRRMGIGWMRERLNWGQVNPQQGTVEWGKYQTVADVLSANGVRNYQIFHDSPGWTHPGKETRNPDDLRHVYEFCRDAAAHFEGDILAWEPWNEPDIFFFDQLGDKYSGIQKAAYLGFKAGKPDVNVLQCSLCRGKSRFSDSIFESGIADYFDTFNFHTYSPIDGYVETLDMWMEMTRDYGVEERPVWLTEAGIRLQHADDEDLTPEQERGQAEFVPRSFAISLAASVDKHFFFVLPHYPERGVQFGAMHPDATPRPALLAIATAVRLMGEGKYLGKLAMEACEGYVFDSGSERVAVVWAEEETELDLPMEDGARVVDVVGRVVEGDAGIVAAGPEMRYVVGLGDVELTGEPRAAGEMPELDPHKVVLVGHIATEEIHKDRNAYMVPAGEPVQYMVDVYNFDADQSTRGSVRVEMPDGWTADKDAADVMLEPLGWTTVAFELMPAAAADLAEPAKVWARGDFGGKETAPCVSYARIDVAASEPTRTLDLELNDAARWAKNIPSNGEMEIESGDGHVSFPITFTGPGDRWCYPRATYADPQDWGDYQGLAYEYRLTPVEATTNSRLQIAEAGGSMYADLAHPATAEWRRVVVLLGDVMWGSYSPVDENGKLDTDAIGQVTIGCNTELDEVMLEVRNVSLVAYD